MSLSIALATHNEEKNILKCLESVYDWVNEIVIVDGKSSDKTVESIKKYDVRHKIKLFNEDNPAMFHVNKQKAIERCTGEWILQLDADEMVSEDLKKEINHVILSDNEGSLANASLTSVMNTSDGKTSGVTPLSGGSPEVEEEQHPIAYWLPRLNYFLGRPLRKGGQYPDYTIRIYKNGVARFPCKSVHEQVKIKAMMLVSSDLGGPSRVKRGMGGNPPESRNAASSDYIGHLKAPLLHFPYPTFDEYLKKWSRYALLEAGILHEKGAKPSLWNFILYMIIYPKCWFLKTYFRHKGFADGFAGFVFSLFSALRFVITYVKLYELESTKS